MSKSVDDLTYKFTRFEAQLTTLSTIVDQKLSSMDNKVVLSKSSVIDALKSQLVATKEREDALRKQLEESLSHTKQLQDKIPVYDDKLKEKLAQEYNEKVVKHQDEAAS